MSGSTFVEVGFAHRGIKLATLVLILPSCVRHNCLFHHTCGLLQLRACNATSLVNKNRLIEAALYFLERELVLLPFPKLLHGLCV